MKDEEAIKTLNRLIYSEHTSNLEIQAIDWALKKIRELEKQVKEIEE